MTDLFSELRRRNVFKVGAAYVVVAWLIAQVAELALDSFEAPTWVMKTLLLLLALGLPLARLHQGAERKASDEIRMSSTVRPTRHEADAR